MNDATADAKAAAQAARRQLVDTIEALEDKFDVPARTSELVEKAKIAYNRNPVPWIVGGAALAVIAVGLVAWAVFSGDDD